MNTNLPASVTRQVLGALLCLTLTSTTVHGAAQDVPAAGKKIASSAAYVLQQMQRVADWQLAHPSTHAEDDWTQGVGYTGMMALAGVSGDARYRDAMLSMGQRNQWQLGPRTYHADDHIVGQTYVELYELLHDPRMLGPMRERFEAILKAPHDGSLDWRASQVMDRWSWCDALFMSPPAWARLAAASGDTRFLDYAIKQWWKTSDFLYDAQEQLYFRDSRFFHSKEANGQKVFWGRGNGWVLGGLVRMLQYIPANHPARERFVTQFQQMAARVVSLQQDDGLWRASLLDPASYPLQETSGTGLYAYALAYGVNQGMLDHNRYAPAVRKAWAALQRHVAEDGKLTHVQPIGEDPKGFNPDATEVYGVGAFLLAGSEVYRMELSKERQLGKLSVKNPAAMARMDELAEAPGLGEFVVMDAATSKILPNQVLDQTLLFPVTLQPNEQRRYLLIPRVALPALPPVIARAHARFVPERLDDFAWESDRTAHRVYGPAIMRDAKEHLVSSGIDVWSKRQRKLVIDDWYASGDYHRDRGDGLDFYKVGSTPGCGGLGVYRDGGLYTSKNFSGWRVIADGPLRAVFELNYEPWDARGTMVAETRRVSIDAGSNFSRVDSRFSSKERTLDIAVGIAHHEDGGSYTEAAKWMSYWQSPLAVHGSVACAVILPGARYTKLSGAYLALAKAYSDRPFSYYLGAGWSQSGDFNEVSDWESYVSKYVALLAQPLVIAVEAAR